MSIVDIYSNKRSMSYRFRFKRFKLLNAVISSIIERKGRCNILDVGGTEYYWNINSEFVNRNQDYIKIYLVNIADISTKETYRPIFENISGDATKVDIYNTIDYDLIHSNSVIEHVGHWKDIRAMAKHIEQGAKPYFVQTPNFWFPMEPHFRTLFYHWLPESVRAEMLIRKTRGFRGKCDNWDEAMAQVESVNLLSYSQLRSLFPRARIVRERFLGFTKSFMIVHDTTFR